MRLIALFLFTTTALAQTALKPATPATPKPATTAAAATAAHPMPHASVGACTKVPDLSPKIPSLPVGSPCAKGLYTITTVPPVKLDNISPLVAQDQLRETLGLESTSFTLAYVDIKVGTGPLAAPHKFYSIQYTGYLTDGTKFDSSYDHTPAEPITIPYGQHQVIPGWDTGFAGMRVGGKRRLFIPFQLAYGPNGKPPTIPAKAELVFDVELVSQSDAPPPPPPAPPAPAATTPTPPPAAPPATPPPTAAPKQP